MIKTGDILRKLEQTLDIGGFLTRGRSGKVKMYVASAAERRYNTDIGQR